MCSRGKHFSWVNLDQYYRCYGKKNDVSTKIPVKFMSSRHICHIFRSYCAFNVGIEFPSRPYACPPCICVTGQTGHATLGNSVLKSQNNKKTGIFYTICKSWYKDEYKGVSLEPNARQGYKEATGQPAASWMELQDQHQPNLVFAAKPKTTGHKM